MKTKLLLLSVLLSLLCHAQDSTKKFFFRSVGWTVQMPEGFTLISKEENKKQMDKGRAAIEQSNGIRVDTKETRTLFTAMNGQNYFSATLEPFNPKKDGNYETANQKLHALLMKTFSDKMQDATIDTTTSTQKINGLSFSKFQVSVTLKNHTIFTMVLLSRWYKGFDFGISYLYQSEAVKEEIEKRVDKSSFAK